MLTYPEVFTTPPDEVIYFYSVLQPKLLELEKNNKIVKLVQGFNSDLYLERNPSTHLAVVIDDLMSSDEYLHFSDLFTKYSRHLNITVIFMTQNAYFKGTNSAAKYNRTILQNSNELVIFKNRRDQVSAMTIGKQAFPSQFPFFKEVYEECTKEPFSYLYMSFNASGKEALTLRSNIFFPTEVPRVYLQR